MIAEKIVEEILDDLHGRQGVGDELDQVRHEYPDIYGDLKRDLTEKVTKVIDSEFSLLKDKITELETHGPHDES